MDEAWNFRDDQTPSLRRVDKTWLPDLRGLCWTLDVWSENRPSSYPFKLGQVVVKGTEDGELWLALDQDYRLG